MIHPETQTVLDYPNTAGKRAALAHYNWQNLDKVNQVMMSSSVIALAKSIDKVNK